MSVTTTTNPVYQTVSQILVDYDLHHSGETSLEEVAPDPNPRTSDTAGSATNPEVWPTNFRRMPNHRPIDRYLDMEQRPDGVNAIERTFIFLMLNGVGINAGIARLWRTTVGSWTGLDFRYKIGGEI